ncbi:MAG: thiol:disulfide interchange protein DsbA/DsbL [Proteobacteria bacterium]|nr:thiol:disulfide interchange protein DsbA/DsbL [Pseudomonadota bacterium]
MKLHLKRLFVAAALLLCGTAFAAVQGKDYTLQNPVQPTSTKKVEVLEFFFYECSHCFHLHPFLATWEKTMPGDVELTFVPTIFRDSTEPLARTYYTLESMGKIKQLDDVIYRAIHEKQVGLYDLDTIAAFVSSNGVDRVKFTADYNSFTVNSKIVRAKQMIRSYGIDGTPTLIVDGKYKITGLQPADTIRVLNEVIAMARKERSAESKSAKAKPK